MLPQYNATVMLPTLSCLHNCLPTYVLPIAHFVGEYGIEERSHPESENRLGGTGGASVRTYSRT